MAYSRSQILNSGAPGFYHCRSQVVQQAMLLGKDPETGKHFADRREWVERRLFHLAESFAVALYGWSIMNNHTHVVLRLAPQAVDEWSDEEVAQRWARISRSLKPTDEKQVARRREALLRDPAAIRELRQRLANISWFMRCLNYCIARAVNQAAGRHGHFWAGRFLCSLMPDEPAALNCLTYVDLNPVAAEMAKDLPTSDFTSVQRRLRDLMKNPEALDAALPAIGGIADASLAPEISSRAYIEMVDLIGRMRRAGKRGRIEPGTPSALAEILKRRK